MNVQIILTDYLLKFMYGDQAFQDSLLLSREVLKKANAEGLYYISSKEMIDKITSSREFPHNIFLFAGIPTLEEIALTQTIRPYLYALHIHIPYELLASFQLSSENQDTCLKGFLNPSDFTYEKVLLEYTSHQQKPVYQEISWDAEKKEDFKASEKEEMMLYFSNSVKQYKYAIKNKLKYIREQWDIFFKAEWSVSYLEDKAFLQFAKQSYEEIVYEDSVKKL